jgi:hypothetical protein
MSRSIRHTPVIGNCSHSDKPGKKIASGTLRAHVRTVLARGDYDNMVMPLLREVSNVWSFPKDGKHRLNPDGANFRKYMRK